MTIVDLGCGHAKRGDIGIDISDDARPDIVCNLGFEKIPLEDNSIGWVYAYDVLEHIPFQIWKEVDGVMTRISPVIQLFNEVDRILEVGGKFDIWVPRFPSSGALGDPTHVSWWTEDVFNYLSGDYFTYHDLYGNTSNFKIHTKYNEGDRLHVILEKRAPDAPYEL